MSTATLPDNGQRSITRPPEPQTPARQRISVNDESPFANLLDTAKFEHMWRIAQLFAGSELVPVHFRGKPSDCFIACNMAVRLGMDPFLLMQNTYVVHGKLGMLATLAIALVNSSGVFTSRLEYEIEGTDPRKDDYRCRAYAAVAGKNVYGEWIDWNIVKGEKWDSRADSKWKSIPGQMFRYRAATWFARAHCPERLMGMMSVDELDDLNPEPSGPHGMRPVASQVIDKALSAGAQKMAQVRQQQNGGTTPPTQEKPHPTEPAQVIDESTSQVPVTEDGEVIQQQEQDREELAQRFDEKPQQQEKPEQPEAKPTPTDWAKLTEAQAIDLAVLKAPAGVTAADVKKKFRIGLPKPWDKLAADSKKSFGLQIEQGRFIPSPQSK